MIINDYSELDHGNGTTYTKPTVEQPIVAWLDTHQSRWEYPVLRVTQGKPFLSGDAACFV